VFHERVTTRRARQSSCAIQRPSTATTRCRAERLGGDQLGHPIMTDASHFREAAIVRVIKAPRFKADKAP
jgi:hypothetical protein